jgi:hypothetical protein
MEQWLATSCAEPGTSYPLTGPFRALLTRWS